MMRADETVGGTLAFKRYSTGLNYEKKKRAVRGVCAEDRSLRCKRRFAHACDDGSKMPGDLDLLAIVVNVDADCGAFARNDFEEKGR